MLTLPSSNGSLWEFTPAVSQIKALNGCNQLLMHFAGVKVEPLLVKLNHVGCRSSSIRGQVRRSKGSHCDGSRLSLKAAHPVIKAGLQLVDWTHLLGDKGEIWEMTNWKT